MKASELRKLTNSYHDVQLFNLGWHEDGKGPYLVRQLGYLPGDAAMEVKPFVLMPDGTWLLSYHLACLPEQEQEKRLFQSMTEVVEVLERIGSRDVQAVATLPEGVSPEEALRRYESTMSRMLRNMKRPVPHPKAGE